jgi:hypothetical protein
MSKEIARELVKIAKELVAKDSKAIAKKLLDSGDIGEWFRGELGAEASDDEKWVEIAKELVKMLNDGIHNVQNK